MSKQLKKTSVETMQEMVLPKFMEEQLATSKMLHDLVPPTFMEEQLATSKMLHDLVPASFMEEQLATSKMLHDLVPATFMEEQLATSKMLHDLVPPTFMEEQFATSKMLHDLVPPTFMEEQFATSRMLHDLVSPKFMEEQLATSKMLHDLVSPKFMEEQFATSKMLHNLVSSTFMEEQLATSRMLHDLVSPKFMEEQFATSRMLHNLVSPKFMEEQFATSKILREFISPKYMEEQLPVSKMIQELSNSVNLHNFLGRLTTDNFSYLMRQVEIADISLLDDFDESDIQAFKDYSQNELSQKPEQFIATQTTEPSKYGQLIISIIFELLKVFIYPYLFAILQAQVALPFLSTDKTATEKQVIIAAKRDFCEEQLSVCRFVKSTKLNVRASAGQKYQVIDTLNFGQGVIIDTFEVNEKDRDWVFVSYYDKTSESYKNGWVFRRYLRRYVP
ncbi:SH3 domain-containing protein [Shewanella vaxholmensis]|uniref:SH3 domain-containing protein n=1 Tax=Shewanella vaxholmensis TaxID=3063535 RepID=A0ABU9UXT8_9GAMM